MLALRGESRCHTRQVYYAEAPPGSGQLLFRDPRGPYYHRNASQQTFPLRAFEGDWAGVHAVRTAPTQQQHQKGCPCVHTARCATPMPTMALAAPLRWRGLVA